MNPYDRNLRNSKIMRMAINRINPNFDKDLKNMDGYYGGHNTGRNRQEAFSNVVKKKR